MRVEDTPRPRSETAAPPEEKPPWKPVEIEPAPSAETERIASLIVVMPALPSTSGVSTVTGEGDSVAVARLNSEPVTTISGAASVDVVLACCANAGAAASTTAVRAEPASSRRAMVVDVTVRPLC